MIRKEIKKGIRYKTINEISDRKLAIKTAIINLKCSEILLVADAMTGQDAVVTAKAFKEAVNISGLVLSRADGDARGGAAISMRHITQCPIKFLGVGEKQEEIELFSADRFARRILGMGDVVGLVEKAEEAIEKEDAEEMMKIMTTGQISKNELL